MTKIKQIQQLRLSVPVSKKDQRDTEKLAKLAGVPLATFIRNLLMERLRSYRDAKKVSVVRATKSNKKARHIPDTASAQHSLPISG